MEDEYQTTDALRREIAQLRQELEEAKSTINAIRHGEVDALLISDTAGDQVYVLSGADHFYRSLVEEMQEGCATIAQNGTILFCNKNFADMLKTPLEHVIGASIHDCLGLSDEVAFAAFLSTQAGNLKAECNLRAGNSLKPAILSASSITLDGDTFTCLVVTDLSEQRRRQRFTQMIFGQTAEPIIACDRAGYIISANPAALALFGAPLAGKLFDTAITIFSAADGRRLRLAGAIDAGLAVEVQYERLDGKTLTLLVSADKFSAEVEDDIFGCIVVFTDVTDKYMLTNELARLERLNLIGEMAAGIGHEVRNPLTTVRGYLQMFARRPKCAEDRPSFELMVEELDRANSIISEFLALAKNKSIELCLGDLNDTVRAFQPLLQTDAVRLGHEIKIETGEIRPVCYDEKEIRQLILNLVRNGLEAMTTKGVITIGTYTENDEVVLTVQDTGGGMPKEVLRKLGTPFFTTKPSGTGLGLSVCYRIAERHNARIEVKSSPQGTTFLVKFKH